MSKFPALQISKSYYLHFPQSIIADLFDSNHRSSISQSQQTSSCQLAYKVTSNDSLD